jgi:hypothetical protein
MHGTALEARDRQMGFHRGLQAFVPSLTTICTADESSPRSRNSWLTCCHASVSSVATMV